MLAFVSWRASAWIAALGFGLAAIMPSPALSSATIAFQNDRAAAEPFGLATIALPEHGSLATKWRVVDAAITEDLKIIAACRANRAACSSQPALAFLKIVDGAAGLSGLTRIGEINRAFNLGIRALSDQAQYGVEDVWTSPLATLTSGAGDCEDYAIAKMVALREAGISGNDVRLLFLHDPVSGDDHAVAAVRIDNRWRILDNRMMLMLEDSDVTKLEPSFEFDSEGAKRFVDPSIAVAMLQAQDAQAHKDTIKDSQPATSASAVQDVVMSDVPPPETGHPIVTADIAASLDAYFAM